MEIIKNNKEMASRKSSLNSFSDSIPNDNSKITDIDKNAVINDSEVEVEDLDHHTQDYRNQIKFDPTETFIKDHKQGTNDYINHAKGETSEPSTKKSNPETVAHDSIVIHDYSNQNDSESKHKQNTKELNHKTRVPDSHVIHDYSKQSPSESKHGINEGSNTIYSDSREQKKCQSQEVEYHVTDEGKDSSFPNNNGFKYGEKITQNDSKPETTETKNSKNDVIIDDTDSSTEIKMNNLEALKRKIQIKRDNKTSESNYNKHTKGSMSSELLSDPVTSHIRMEEIQWERILQKKLIRETRERELEKQYMANIKTQMKYIEKQKKIDQLDLKRRMVEFERRRRIRNNTFCRNLFKKDKEHEIENGILYQKILEIDKQKQRNIDKLRERINELEERKQREQCHFLKRMQDLERKREEEFEASQKRIEEMEKRKYNERKAWLFYLKKVNSLEKEYDSPFSNNEHRHKVQGSNLQMNIKDQFRIMENVKNKNPDIRLPKLHIKKSKIDRAKTKTRDNTNRTTKNKTSSKTKMEELSVEAIAKI